MELAQQFQCPICALAFDFITKKPMMICIAQHTICKECLQAIFKKGDPFCKCPFCRTNIFKDQVAEFRLLEQIKVTASKLRKEGSVIRKQLVGAKKNEKQLQDELNAQKQKNEWLLSQLDLRNMLLRNKNKDFIQCRAQNERLQKLVVQLKMTIEKLTVKAKEEAQKIVRNNKQNNITRGQSREELRKRQHSLSINKKEHHQNEAKKNECLIPKNPQNQKLIKKGLCLKQIDLGTKLNLVELDLSENQLSSINLSKNVALKKVNLSWNQLASIDLTSNSHLKELSLSYNQFESVNLSKNINLTHLDLTKNQINYLNLNNNKNLQVFEACLNQLSSIDLTKNVNLVELNLAQNKLERLDLRANPQLRKVNASLNRLSEAILDKSIYLTDLNLQKNNLNFIDLTQNTNLTLLNMGSNLLASIDLMKSSNIVDLNLQGNKFTAVINLMCNLKLSKLNLSNNQLKGIDLTNNRNIIRLNLSQNKFFSIKFFFRPEILINLNDTYQPALQISNQNSSRTQIEVSMKSENKKQCVQLIEKGIQQYHKNGKWNKYNSQYIFSMLQKN